MHTRKRRTFPLAQLYPCGFAGFAARMRVDTPGLVVACRCRGKHAQSVFLRNQRANKNEHHTRRNPRALHDDKMCHFRFVFFLLMSANSKGIDARCSEAKNLHFFRILARTLDPSIAAGSSEADAKKKLKKKSVCDRYPEQSIYHRSIGETRFIPSYSKRNK